MNSFYDSPSSPIIFQPDHLDCLRVKILKYMTLCAAAGFFFIIFLKAFHDDEGNVDEVQNILYAFAATIEGCVSVTSLCLANIVSRKFKRIMNQSVEEPVRQIVLPVQAETEDSSKPRELVVQCGRFQLWYP